MTFHALGLVRRLHQGAADEFPPKRIAIERDVIRGADADRRRVLPTIAAIS